MKKICNICNKKFIDRFQLMELLIREDQKVIHELPLNVLDEYWNKAKKMTK